MSYWTRLEPFGILTLAPEGGRESPPLQCTVGATARLDEIFWDQRRKFCDTAERIARAKGHDLIRIEDIDEAATPPSTLVEAVRAWLDVVHKGDQELIPASRARHRVEELLAAHDAPPPSALVEAARKARSLLLVKCTLSPVHARDDHDQQACAVCKAYAVLNAALKEHDLAKGGE